MPIKYESTRRAIRTYKKNIKKISFELNRRTDGDLLEFLETIENKNGYLKKLVREDMARQSENKADCDELKD